MPPQLFNMNETNMHINLNKKQTQNLLPFYMLLLHLPFILQLLCCTYMDEKCYTPVTHEKMRLLLERTTALDKCGGGSRVFFGENPVENSSTDLVRL